MAVNSRATDVVELRVKKTCRIEVLPTRRYRDWSASVRTIASPLPGETNDCGN